MLNCTFGDLGTTYVLCERKNSWFNWYGSATMTNSTRSIQYFPSLRFRANEFTGTINGFFFIPKTLTLSASTRRVPRRCIHSNYHIIIFIWGYKRWAHQPATTLTGGFLCSISIRKVSTCWFGMIDIQRMLCHQGTLVLGANAGAEASTGLRSPWISCGSASPIRLPVTDQFQRAKITSFDISPDSSRLATG